MKRFFKVAALVTLLLVAFSSFALAADHKEADINYGEKGDDDKGGWGFVWTKTLDDETTGQLQPYLKMKEKRLNKIVVGPYVEGGQSLTTIIGSDLDVNYSPYVAKFHSSSRLIGLRVYPMNLDLGLVNLDFDFAYIWAKHGGDILDNPIWKPDGSPFEPIARDVLLGVKGKVWEIDLETALVRMAREEDDGYTHYHNYSVQGELEVIPGLVVKGLYAGYSESENYLYEVTANYDAVPGLLSLRAGHRNSNDIEDIEFKDNGKDIAELPLAIVGGLDATNDRHRYVSDLKPIQTIYNRDNSVNVGATVWYDFGIVENELKVDYDTTNPAKRGDLDDKVTVALDTTVLNFNLWQQVSVMFPDEESDREIVEIHDPKANRLDYSLKFRAKYDLPVPVVNYFTATGMVNFDLDSNYVEESRKHTIVGLGLDSSVDVLKAKNIGLGAYFFYDMPSDKDLIEDPFKYALLAKYDAPNGIKFRLEYNSSVDFGTSTKHVHQQNLNDRYKDFRHYDNSKFNGFRFAVGIPL